MHDTPQHGTLIVSGGTVETTNGKQGIYCGFTGVVPSHCRKTARNLIGVCWGATSKLMEKTEEASGRQLGEQYVQAQRPAAVQERQHAALPS